MIDQVMNKKIKTCKAQVKLPNYEKYEDGLSVRTRKQTTRASQNEL